MLSKVYKSLASAVSEKLNIDVDEVKDLFEIPKNRSRGDVALPCFKLGKNPKETASKAAEALNGAQFCLEASTAGPFVNVKLDFSAIYEELISDTKTAFSEQKKVLLEYSSPNIAKPFHVGHLRATLIGAALDRTLSVAGHEVVTVNHLGDWGTQFGFVWAGSQIWGKPEEESVKALVDIYRKATSLKEEQEKEGESEVNKMARDYFLRLESGEKEATEFWKWCSDISLTYLKATYQRLGISFDHYIGESFYAPMLEEIKADLETKNLLSESDGAFGVDLGEELGFARITSEDGRSLYLARDIAALKYRSERFKPDLTYYVVGAPQTLHFKQLAQIGKAAYGAPLEHIEFGTVLGMKTRGSGSFIELNDFLDEAEEHALEAYHSQVEKRPEDGNDREVARAVALAAIIYSTLSRSRIKDVNFNWSEALSFTGETGPYLLYAYARICSIERKAEIKIEENFVPEFELISDEASVSILSSLLEFERFLGLALKDKDPMHIASYAINLAKAFSSVYRELRVVGEKEEIAKARLSLFRAVRNKLGQCLELLGIPPLEKM